MADFSLPDELKTGTILDECMDLLQPVIMFAQGLMQFDEEGKELKEARDYFEKEFSPGQRRGSPDSVYLSWLYFDFRFGRKKETVCERLMKEEIFQELIPRGRDIIRQMAKTYIGFYEITDVLDDKIIFKELAGNRDWFVHRINEPFEKNAALGDIWYLRLFGSSDDAYIYTAPFVFPPQSKRDFVMRIEKQKELFARRRGNENLSDEDILRESYKETVRMWLRVMLNRGIAEA